MPGVLTDRRPRDQSTRYTLITVLAGLLLITYISFLLFSNYQSTVNLQATMLEQRIQEVRNRASEWGYFFAERRDDLINLDMSREVRVFFENRALGMSMRYGLSQSLIPIREQFRQLIQRKHVGDQEVYSRLALVDGDGNPIVNTAAQPSSAVDWQAFLDPTHQPGRVVVDESSGGALISSAYYFKGNFAGQLLAWIDKRVLQQQLSKPGGRNTYLLYHQGNRLQTIGRQDHPDLPRVGAILSQLRDGKSVGVVTGGANESEGKVLLGTPVNGTPFTMVQILPAPLVYGEQDPGRLLTGMAILALVVVLVSGGFLRLNFKAAVLRNRLEESSLRERTTQEINRQLEQEVSERQRIELELRNAKEAAEAANQAKGDFLARMSHEIRTPMNGVMGMTELIRETELTAEQRLFADTIQHSADALLSVINDVLDFSKIDAGKMELQEKRFDMRALMDEISALFAKHAADKGLRLRSRVASDLESSYQGDPDRLRQILVNLVSNAIKFTDQGEITLRVQRSSDDAVTQWLQFEVIDSGIGISRQEQSHIFEYFTQIGKVTTRKHGGTGLGLAICKQLTELMGGRIDVDSAPNAGSRFRVEVPFKRYPAYGEYTTKAIPDHEPTASEEPLDLRTDAPPTILVAEDNPANQAVIMGMLGELGHQVSMVADGRQVLSKTQNGHYDLILMDCLMPVMNGYEAARAIRTWELANGERRTPIIAVTASAMADDRDFALASGMDDYLSKPYTLSQLRTLLEQWLPESTACRRENESGTL